MATITMNKEKNGIEIRFEGKPEREILDILKANGFRWSKYQKMWYAKNNDSRMELVNSMFGEGDSSMTEKVKQNKCDVNMWELTRTENIPYHYGEERLHDTKEIAKRIRTHLRKRFSMCKWSVTSDYNSVDIRLKSSPWEKGSDIVNAILDYANKYSDSYNYNNSDAMTDYFDVNFYGHAQISWEYEQTEETVGEMLMREKFAEDQAEAKRIEEIEAQKRYEQYMKEEAERERQYEERRKIEVANHEKVMANVEVKDVDEYFILNLKERDSKNSSVDGYLIDRDYGDEETNKRLNAWKRCDCKVSREVYMSKEIYDLFSHQLLDDWDFLAGKGGYTTDDNRINDNGDYGRLSEEERKTVKWYNIDCVAVIVDGELTMVIDPEGYNYARYCFFIDEETISHGEYLYKQVVSDADKEDNKQMAQVIEDASATIISENGLMDSWNTDRRNEYRQFMIQWLEGREDIDFTIDVIREIGIPDLKIEMLDLYETYNGIQEQFKRAGLTENRKITMIKIGDLGGITPQHMIFKSYEPTRYAQYDNAVKIVFRPERKRNDYYTHLYNEVLIYDGYVDIPDDLFWEIEQTAFGTIRKSKYHMHDHQMYEDVLEYFRKQGIEPLINTYKAA